MSVRLERLIRIYNRLRSGPVTIAIINQWAKSAGIVVSERQLYRDLNSLELLQIAKGESVIAYVDEKNKKTWKLEYNSTLQSITEYDINSFFLFKILYRLAFSNTAKHPLKSLNRFFIKTSAITNIKKEPMWQNYI